MIINFYKGVYTIAAHSRPVRESGAIPDQPPEWHWTGDAWHPTSENAKTFINMLDAMSEMGTIANLPD